MSTQNRPYDLIQFLTSNATPRSVFELRCPTQNAPTNPTRLAKDVFGIEQHSLQSWYKNRIPVDRFDFLAQKYGIELELRKVLKDEGHEAFVAAYEKYWLPKLHSAGTASAAIKRIYDPNVQLQAIPIAPPDNDDNEPVLASVELFLNQAGPDDPEDVTGRSWEVSMFLICQPEPIGSPTFDVAVKRGLLEFAPGEAEIGSSIPLLGTDGTVAFTRKDDEVVRKIRVSLANRRNNNLPVWDISCEEHPIGVFRLDDEKPLCRITRPAIGDQVTLRFKVWIKDLDITEPDPEDYSDDANELRSFLRPDSKPMSPNTRAAIKALFIKEEFTKNELNGWIEVARDGRQFQREEQRN